MNTFFMLAMAPGGESGNPIAALMPIIIIFGLFYVVLIRPQQRKEKARRAMIEQIKVGDRILFSGGILGKVWKVQARSLIVEIAEKVRVEVARGAVFRVLGDDEVLDKDAVTN